jgi:hypothetical protein
MAIPHGLGFTWGRGLCAHWRQVAVRLTAHLTVPSETLTQSYAAALTRYTDGAEASIYLLGKDGNYHFKAGQRHLENGA